MNRPSGLPRSRDRLNGWDAMEEADFAEVLDNIPFHDGVLCTECSRIDFEAFFDFFKPKTPLTTSLNHALRQSHACVFCSAIATAASKRPALLEAARDRELECDIRSWIQHDVGEVRKWQGDGRRHAYPYLTLTIHVKSSKNRNEIPWLPEWLSNTNLELDVNEDCEFLLADHLLVLELVGINPDGTRLPCFEDGIKLGGSGGGDELSSSDSESSDAGSMTSDFEAEYTNDKFAGSTSRQFRVPLGPTIDYDNLNWHFKRHCTSAASEAESQTTAAGVSIHRLVKASRLRLINVRSGNVDIIQEPQRYVALSYVWGSSVPRGKAVSRPDSTLTTDNKAWSIDWRLVPRTISDAREMVRRLGELYLWVDSLCIAQEDEEDKRAIIPEMTAIYGSACVTLVAVAGNDSNHGLPGVSENSRRPDICLSFPNYGKQVRLVPKRPTCFSLVYQSTWHRRAWTYQEYILSPRIIFVTAVEAFMVVGNQLYSERSRKQKLVAIEEKLTQTSLPPISSGEKTTAHEALIKAETPKWSHYGDSLVAYSPRQLTHPEDRLAAFLGVLNRFCEESDLGDAYMTLSGLPPQWFYASLMWEHSFHTTEPNKIQFDSVQLRKPPSWSWTGWTGAISLHESRLSPTTQKPRVRVLDNANIMCESLTLGTLNPWPFEPPLCPETSGEAITLHLLATRIELYLRQRRGPLYAIEMYVADSGTKDHIGNIWLDPHTAEKFANNEPQRFILFGHLVMLVEDLGEFYERRDLGRLMWRDNGNKTDGRSERITRYVQQSGVLQHVKLR